MSLYFVAWNGAYANMPAKGHMHAVQTADRHRSMRMIDHTDVAGVEEVKVDAGAGKVTVKGFAFDVEKLRKKVEKGCRKKVELIPPAPPKDDMVVDVKTKKEVNGTSMYTSDNTACM
jgi:hypothetical protein